MNNEKETLLKIGPFKIKSPFSSELLSKTKEQSRLIRFFKTFASFLFWWVEKMAEKKKSLKN